MVLIFLLLSCGRNMGIDQGRKEIQEYLYLKYKKLFKIEKIEKIDISKFSSKHLLMVI